MTMLTLIYISFAATFVLAAWLVIELHLARQSERDLGCNLTDRRGVTADDQEPWGDLPCIPDALVTRFHAATINSREG